MVKVLKFEKDQIICNVGDFKELYKRLIVVPLPLLHFLSRTAEVSPIFAIVFDFSISHTRFQFAALLSLLPLFAVEDFFI